MKDINDKPVKPSDILNPNPETHEQYTLQDYNQDMTEVAQGNYGALARIGLPKPKFDIGGIWFFIMLPVLLAWLLIVDPFNGWVRWRVIGLLLGVAVTLIIFGVLVFVGVQQELGEPFGLSENSPAFLLLENIGAAGLATAVLFIWPRTIALLLVIAAVISLIRWIV